MIHNGEIQTQIIRSKMAEILTKLDVDYIAFVDRDFKEILKIKEQNSIVLVAAKVGKTRLIDNLWI